MFFLSSNDNYLKFRLSNFIFIYRSLFRSFIVQLDSIHVHDEIKSVTNWTETKFGETYFRSEAIEFQMILIKHQLLNCCRETVFFSLYSHWMSIMTVIELWNWFKYCSIELVSSPFLFHSIRFDSSTRKFHHFLAEYKRYKIIRWMTLIVRLKIDLLWKRLSTWRPFIDNIGFF